MRRGLRREFEVDFGAEQAAEMRTQKALGSRARLRAAFVDSDSGRPWRERPLGRAWVRKRGNRRGVVHATDVV